MAQEYYDIALSFAGEDRRVAEEIFDALTEEGVSVFYDDNEQADLWGKNLYDYLSDVYLNRAKYCIILVSKYYLEKVWTNHERQAAQARAIKQKKEYILPIMLDNSQLIGFETVAFLKWPQQSVSSITDKILYKLGIESSDNPDIEERITYIPGWSPPVSSHLTPEMKTAFVLERDTVKKRALCLLLALISSLIGIGFLLIGVIGARESNFFHFSVTGRIVSVLIAVAIFIYARHYLTWQYPDAAKMLLHTNSSSMGIYLGAGQFARKKGDKFYLYKMSMKCIFPGCDGTVYIAEEPSEDKKYFTARCAKRWNSHSYKVLDDGIAIALE